MPIAKIYPTTHFVKSYKNLPEKIRTLSRQKEGIFLADPFDSQLKTHKLKGRLKHYWSYSVDYQYRVMFRFIDNTTVLYLDIGKHDIYR